MRCISNGQTHLVGFISAVLFSVNMVYLQTDCSTALVLFDEQQERHVACMKSYSIRSQDGE